MNEESQQGGPHAARPTPRLFTAEVETVPGTAWRVRQVLSAWKQSHRKPGSSISTEGTEQACQCRAVQQEAGWQPRRQRAGGWLVPPTAGHTLATRRPSQQPQQLLGGKCSSFHIVCSCQCTQLCSSPQITVPDQRRTAEDVFRFSLRLTAGLWVHKQGWRRWGHLVSRAHTLPSPRRRSCWFSPAGRLCSLACL